MAFEFTFPDVGEGIHEGRIVEWLVAEGDAVEEDQTVMKVETDKAVVDLPAPTGGTILKIHAAAGDTIHVGDVILTIGSEGEPVPQPQPPETKRESATEPSARPASEAATPAPQPPRRPLATPHTRALARKLGVDISAIQGTGPGGRITDQDVESAAAPSRGAGAQPVPGGAQAAVSAQPARTAVDLSGPGDEIRVKASHLRSIIAAAMAESKRTAAHVTHVDEADVTDLLAMYKGAREYWSDATGSRLSLLPFFIKALVCALKAYPIFNAAYDAESGEIIYKKRIHVGFAVDTPEGLIVPVVHDADRRTILEISGSVQDLAARARERKLTLDEIQGGTCTITNIGPIGGLFATPIIHQPELAIVGTHAIQERPVVRNGEIVVRNMMYTTVSFDHRIIDGAEAARFMSDFVRFLSNPLLLSVNI